MPSRDAVKDFIAQVMSGDHVGAIERWYATDASMQENQDEPRLGRERLLDEERQTLTRFTSVSTELLEPPIVDGERVAIRWRFTFTLKDGSTRAMEEVAWQTWRDGKIWRETFFYDPKQMG